MRPYRDAFVFFLKYFGVTALTGLLCEAVDASAQAAGVMIVFGPLVVMYFILVRLLKRYTMWK